MYASTGVSTQYVTHGGTQDGYTLPSYTSNENVGCPPDVFELFTASGGTTVPTDVSAIQTIGGNKVVTPANSALHQQYQFYVKVSESTGGSFLYFGPYTLRVGCFASSVTFYNSGSNWSVSKWVGDPVASVYTLNVPTSNRAWCTI